MHDKGPCGVGGRMIQEENFMTDKPAMAPLASCAPGLLGGTAMAQDFDYGKFDGYALKVKLIGGTQYEKFLCWSRSRSSNSAPGPLSFT